MRAIGGVVPFLKWPGGKRFLAPFIAQFVNLAAKDRYFEPFVGGGAVFFRLQPDRAVIADRNPALIECYQILKRDPELVISTLKRARNDEESYYRIRNSKPRTEHGRAARLIYLCRLSFNGIYRENQRGEFNVPYGYKTESKVAQPDLLIAASELLQSAEIECCDFAEATVRAKNGDVVYFDPPYTVAHNNNGFVKYNRNLFSWSDQERLALEAKRLSDLGCTVLVSNADHPSVRALYDGFKFMRIRRTSVMAASADFRGEVTEALLIKKAPSKDLSHTSRRGPARTLVQ